MRIARPHAAEHTYRQRLASSPAEVMPLLCPVREADWIEGWDPLAVYSESGFVERDCVFVTAGEPHDAVWYVVRHDEPEGYVEMIKITPGVTACRLSIQLHATPEGCDADVTYRHTSLGPAGDCFVEEFTDSFYEGFMREWEDQLNHYLRAGEALPAGS